MKKIILDVDTGVDDAMAIMVALSSPNVEVIGITCCHGNTPLDNVVTNTLRVLQVCKKTECIQAAGSLCSAVNSCEQLPRKGRTGRRPGSRTSSQDQLQGRKAAAALSATVPFSCSGDACGHRPAHQPGRGGSTHPDFPKKLKALYIMGGNTECRHSGRGNTTVCGEFNFVADPEAAHIVLDRYTCPTYIAGWEFTCRNSLPWVSLLRLQKARSKDYREKETTEGSGFNSCDTYAVAAAVDDEFILEKEEVAVTVELEGTHTRGMMVLDYMGLLKKDHKAFIMKKVDLEKLKKMLITALK
uniref:Inosine/uridine-preferring nucleoside hydrolase domain-containing protein n=1 Tax=Salarias fasciatus TaxID=181472 RepID=A0A672IFU0_SALFA